MSSIAAFPEVGFGGFSRHCGTVAFYCRVNALVRPNDTVLDIGCGRGAWLNGPIPYVVYLRQMRGKCRSVWGCDVDASARLNPSIDRFWSIDHNRWEVPSLSVDVAIADYVLEHIADPRAFFSEVNRVLKPGGVLCIRTPNAWGYVGVAARLVPNSMHGRVISRIQPGRDTRDVFPTHYRCNSIRRIRSAMRDVRLAGVVYSHESEPSYLGKGAFYQLGCLVTPLIPTPFRNVLFAYARKAE